MKGDLRRRLLVAAVGIPASVIVVYVGGIVLALGLSFLAAVGFWEYAAMLRTKGHAPFPDVGLAGAILLPIAMLIGGSLAVWPVCIALVAAAGVVGMLRLDPGEAPIANAALTVFGALYLGGLLSFGVPLREWFVPDSRVEGTLLFFYPVLVTWGADTAAYFGGKSLGRRQLAPTISPNKTVEGAIAAVIAGALGSLVYALWVLPLNLGGGQAIVFGLLIAVLAIVGDLVESALKRECGQKDSSNLLPGHGGFLDRLDSLLWTIPGAYLFFAAGTSP